jgi:short-chain fatty acids transporter
LVTVLAGFFNWGFALVLGAILARKVGEEALRKGFRIHYPLVGAAGYAGLLVWHGGLSGSAPLRVNDPANEFIALMGNKPIPPSDTLFSAMNLTLSAALIVVLPLGMYLLARRLRAAEPLQGSGESPQIAKPKPESAAERLDFSRVLSLGFGVLFLLGAFYIALMKPAQLSLQFLTPNFINFLLLGLCLVAHRHFRAFLDAVDQAIVGSSGIMIQFPLYAGIMGILSGSGLVAQVTEGFVAISNPDTFPIFTFFSAGLVNFFVPSGGGQWAIQGGIVLQAAQELGVSQPKAVMALCYGDQLTNMLQPFWALPLLGITGLRARDILPYTFFMMILAAVLILGALLIF